MHAVIMAGGRGTRFWPRSRKLCPKQLINISGQHSMIRQTADRLSPVCHFENMYVMTSRDLVESTAAQLNIPLHNIIGEPQGRNTAPCIGFMTALISRKHPDSVIGVFPSDHFIADTSAFAEIVQNGAIIAEKTGKIVTLGLKPVYPATGYGYIELGEKNSEETEYYGVLSFREKPDLKTAEEFISAGNYVWNSGMFIFRADAMLEEFSKFMPQSYAVLEEFLTCEDPMNLLQTQFEQLDAISIDYGIMEKTPNIVAMQADIGWNDVGSFNSLYGILEKDPQQNAVQGDAIFHNSSGCYVFSDTVPVMLESCENMTVVATKDAILVCPRDKSENVGKLVKHLETTHPELL